jgi:hypothetical protein
MRLAMGFESFWLDEAWSLSLAREARSALDVFSLFHDNNHLLNTLYLYAVDERVGRGHWIAYRVPALLAGCLSLVVLYRIALRFGRLEAGFALALAATSFPLVSASAQARGYAGAILCSLLYFALARRWAPGTRPPGAMALAFALGLAGLLFHPTFVYAFAGTVAWCAVRELEAGQGLRRTAVTLLARHGGTAIALALLYAFFHARIEVGGGPSYERFATVRQAIAQTLALPRRGPLTWVASVVALGLALQGMRVLVRGRDREGVFLLLTLVAAPALVIALTDPEVFYARYLLATFPWFLLLVAVGLGPAWRSPGMPRALAGAVVAWFVLANGWKTVTVLAEGRDDYVRTLEYLDRHTRGPLIEVGSDHDFRNATLLRFYAGRLDSPRLLVYRRRSEWPAEGPEWYLRHDWKAGHDPDRRFEPDPGLVYQLVESFEHGPGDGFQWFVYRREDRLEHGREERRGEHRDDPGQERDAGRGRGERPGDR